MQALSELLKERINQDVALSRGLWNSPEVNLEYGHFLKGGKNRYYLQLTGENIYLRVYACKKPASPESILQKAADELREIIKDARIKITI